MCDIRQLYNSDFLNPNHHVSKRFVPESISINGNSVECLIHERKTIINENIIVIAPPKEGKTTLMKSMLVSIRSLRPTLILIAPTNTLGEEFIPNFMWINSKQKYLNNILTEIQRYQTEMRGYHDAGNKLKILTEIANKLKLSEGHAKDKIKQLNKRALLSNNKARYTDDLMVILRYYINKTELATRKHILTKREYDITINMLQEPYMVMIFDDMGQTLRGLVEYNNMCTNYRHMSITMITLIHHGNMIHTVARNCASYKITRHSSDMIWLIDSSKGSTNAYTESFIYKYGELIAQNTSKNRYFLVLSNNHKHVKLQLLFTAVQFDIMSSYYSCNNEKVADLLSSADIKPYDLCKYLRSAIMNGIIR